MAKQPYIPLYIGDWIQDTDCLSIEAEGAWLRVIFKCWKNKGIFTATEDVFARLCKIDTTKFASILLEWQQNNICDIVSGPNGQITVVSRRIKRDKEISALKSENGSKGGSKTQAKRKANGQAKVEQNPEYDIDNESESEIKVDYKKESETFDSTIVITQQNTLPKDHVMEALLLDEIYIENLKLIHKGKDIKQAFGECYIHHSNAPNPPKDIAGWKQKLNTWLINTRHNGTSKKGESGINARREGFAKRHSSDSGG